ncbi:MAG TPA: peptide-methionine (S)-S-oxide reductase MsrA [Polyangiaceae bacterium]|nr:peptide-methionine (S)-S-oxide reductase MsrA [Polyangiaceae bacterium]
MQSSRWLTCAALILLCGCDRDEARPPASGPPAGQASSAVAAGAPAAKSGGGAAPRKAADAGPASPRRVEVAVLAGGCFWGMEEILRQVPGVVRTEVGYAGDAADLANYETVSSGRTRHAEAVRVEFDPSRLSYAELLESWFFRMHDPTTPNRQGNDVGPQYRSAIFVQSDAQRAVAEQVLKRVAASGRWSAPIVTTIERAPSFTAAEDDHQDYLQKNPNGYTCHYLRD